ncbi:uncharacterized protein LOC6558374 [Drosophila grimshawi]|uniref:GH15525 n=1 Tax=Drosophila grimshawi TaxID=7222 RepID=B4J1J6_DROGR|nr:uncharacterized protein LOC6558374 [Drosophila grimshawi]EDV95887.1 GH15525 [Drosophila grimshawi]
MTRSVYEVQRDFALSCGFHSQIIWDALAPDQADVLKQKIANLIGQNVTKLSKTLERQRQKLFENVWEQRKYTNRMLLSAIIYVLVTSEKDPELALESTSFSCHPVIRTRKCMWEDNSDNSDSCCMIFIDEHGRVYPNWRQYIFNNTLPRGTMVAPSQGIYTFTKDQDHGVHLMLSATPASRVNRQILNAGDSIATVGGLAATVPIAAALAFPVAAPILLTATLVGVSSAAYSTVRSVGRLFDRRQHKQSISLVDNEARNSWLNVAGGVVGLGAAGATTAMTVAQTEINATTQLAVKSVSVSSIVLSGTGVANGIYDIYLKISDDQPLSSLDVLQIASGLVIFTHSINNLRIANKATNGNALRDAVRNQTSKAFGQIVEESAKLNSDVAGGGKKFDVVRTFNDIPFKEVLLSLHEIHRNLKQGSTAFGAVGAALLPKLVSLDDVGKLRLNVNQLTSWLGSKFVQHIGNLGSLLDVLDALAKYFCVGSVELILQMACNFLEKHVDSIDRALHTFLSTEMVLYRILMQCVNNYENFTVEFLESQRDEILAIVSKYFQSMRPLDEQHSRRIKCADCHGVHYIMDV